jgi:hypothetical protein
MLSMHLIVVLAFLFGFVVCLMVVTELERRSIRIAERKVETEKADEPAGQTVRIKIEH